MQQLVQALKLNSSHNVEAVVMEKLTVRKQMQKVFCTDIMIGVHGAGLTW